MLKNLKDRKSYAYKYRIMFGNEPRYFRFVVMLAEDGKHFVLCEKDINDTITAETAFLEKQKASITFTQIAESLASNYDAIYYVDSQTGEYVGFDSNNIFGELKVNQSGDDFFKTSKDNASILIHPQDRERLLRIFDNDYMISALEDKKQFSIEYRLIIDDRVQHTRLSARKSRDGIHLIIGVENISRPPFPNYGDLKRAMEGLEKGTFKILLSHDPSHWRRGVLHQTDIALTLSGHTHAGQVKIGKFSPAKWAYNEWGGKYTEGGSMLYVSLGIGGTVPFRFGAWPEINVITLRRKES